MNRRTAVIVGTVMAAILVIGGVVAGITWFAADDDEAPAAAPTAPPADASTSTSASPPVDEAWALEVAAALADQDPDRVSTAMPAAVAAAYLQNPLPLLPPGVDLAVDLEGWTRTGETTAHVPAELTGALQERWVLLLLREGDEWTVYGTAPDGSAP